MASCSLSPTACCLVASRSQVGIFRPGPAMNPKGVVSNASVVDQEGAGGGAVAGGGDAGGGDAGGGDAGGGR
eukprot:8432923-Pyramimonas_sp.AAC.1